MPPSPLHLPPDHDKDCSAAPQPGHDKVHAICKIIRGPAEHGYRRQKMGVCMNSVSQCGSFVPLHLKSREPSSPAGGETLLHFRHGSETAGHGVMAAARLSQLIPAAGCRISPLGHPSSHCSRALPRVWLPLGLGGWSHVLQQQHQQHTSLCGRWGGWNQPQQQAVLCRSLFKDAPSESMLNDEEWQRQRREESKEFARLRELEENEGMEHADTYRKIQQNLQDFPQEEIKKAKKFVAGLIRAGSRVEELIEEAADKGELTPLVLLVVKNRLELAQQDDERDAAQALDLLYRRIQTEVLQRESSLAMVLLNELLNLHDGISHEEWLQQCRRTMLDIFPPEDAFTILGRPGFDLSQHHGPIDAPEEEDDTVLLRVDFIREVDEFLSTLEQQNEQKVAEGLDADAVALRLRQQDKLRAIQLVKDLRRIAIKLKW